MIIETREPIKIEVIFDSRFDLAIVSLDGVEYAYLKDITQDSLNVEALKYWIENTYYDGDYKCSQYIPCALSGSDFSLEVTHAATQ